MLSGIYKSFTVCCQSMLYLLTLISGLRTNLNALDSIPGTVRFSCNQRR